MSRSWDVAIPQAMQQHGGRNHLPPKPTPKPEPSPQAAAETEPAPMTVPQRIVAAD